MPSYTQLIVAGYILTPVMAALILIPWFRGRTDLFSVWSLFMLGSINFIALGMISNGRGLQTSAALGEHNIKFIAGTVLFYMILAVVYLYPRKSLPTPSPRWLRWPADTRRGLIVVSITLSTVAFIGAITLPAFQGAQIIFVTRTPMAIAGFATAVYLVCRYPKNPLIWTVAAYCFAIGLAVALTWGTGRRELLALVIVPPVVAYWTYFRYANKAKTLFAIGILSVGGIISVTAYQTFRHEDRHAASAQERVMSRIQKFPAAIGETVTNWNWFGEGGAAAFDTQNAVACGLRTIHALEVTGDLDRFWFHTPIYIVCNPIPRTMFPDKPIGLGKTLPLAYGKTTISWGPSIIGHAFYDGGWLVLILYAVVLGRIIRFFDGQLAADPDNIWTKVLLLSVAGHILGFSRGDCGNFGVQIVGMLVILPLLFNILRPLAGTRMGIMYRPVASVQHLPAGSSLTGSSRVGRL